MYRTLLLLLNCFTFCILSAQQATNPPSMAKVNVFVTDMQGKPSKGEQVFFKSAASQKLVSGRSDATGKFGLELPVGDTYTITIKSLTDTTKYGRLDIPALGADEEYTEPFKVNVKFQLAKSYTLDNVHFDFAKATLRAESFPELEELVNYMKYKETLRIEIAGHTDNVGKDADNLKLSQQRAESIRSYLIKKGIAGTRIVAKGYGASQPVADNSTDEGRQLNRRTEVRIL
jgi:OmpA-OmpF porin, OOP family